ncbi:ALBINO3-like protein 3, mitochondrial [Sesamum angolense]|uniref:ALBINO3-like protein 3, mitochondrial n=1 Tax=Sesamum angolense TaxID=2727404 RepID=A0AAE1WKG9_9LAMI|nr:ALBINO3-like protein 3, mitochondrial [Sesamum angolense]
MRPLTSKILRRSRLSPPLFQIFCNYSSSSSYSHSLFGSSIQHHHDHNRPLSYFPRCSSALLSPPRHHCFSFCRRFSSQPNLSESDDPFLPVQALISLLDAYHDATAFPWWIIISSSTVAMRLALFPLVVLQLKKLKRIGEVLPKLPPPFPPPLSGRSFRDQIALFWKEKKAAGCPSVFWFVSSFAFQVPCFFLWIMSIRRMSLDHHPGFDSGGILWFQDLTGCPHGVLGPIVPLIIAGLHFTNVQSLFFTNLWLIISLISIIVSVPNEKATLDTRSIFSKIIIATRTGFLRIINKDIQDLSATADTAYFDCYIQCSPGMLSILAYKWFFESDTESCSHLVLYIEVTVILVLYIILDLVALGAGYKPQFLGLVEVEEGGCQGYSHMLENGLDGKHPRQLLCLRNPNVLEFLGLPVKQDPVVAPTNKEKGSSDVADICILTKQGEVSAKSLSPAELVAYSIKILTDGHRDTAIRLLRLALEKDPDHARALLIMGQTLLQTNNLLKLLRA